MYYPFFRGKLNELIAIRETANVIADSGFIPIISPVRNELKGLHKALVSLCEAGAQAVVVVNPEHGQLRDDGEPISALLEGEFNARDNLSVGIRLDAKHSAEEVLQMCADAGDRPITFIHSGFKDANALIENLSADMRVNANVFIEDDCGKLYQRKFRDATGQRILVRDGFERRRNRDHPNSEFFSDLHITYEDESMDGFGDYLIVGDEYSEGGGPAYTIAIHLTYIDPGQDNAMFLRHFLSDRQDTPKDPGGKFSEALTKLIAFLDGPHGYKFYQGNAVTEFRDLHAREHYPGLGYAKKLSMIHHIETMADFFSTDEGA